MRVDYTTTLSAAVSEPETNHQWKSVTFAQPVNEPVVILGPATRNGGDRGVMQVANVTSTSADLRFKEWVYRDGKHVPETAALLALPKGVHISPDGSIWEVGSFDLDKLRRFKTINFAANFAQTPTLLLTPQTANEEDTFVARTRNLTASSFDAALYEEEALATSGHGTETIGYIAIYAPTPEGTATVAGQTLSYRLSALDLTHGSKTVEGIRLYLEEEQSKDSEIKHTKERVNTALINGRVFAQDVTVNGGDAVSVRRRDATPEVEETIAATNLYFYHNSHLGTPEVMTGADQGVVWSASYNPFGSADVSNEIVEIWFDFPGNMQIQKRSFSTTITGITTPQQGATLVLTELD